MKVFIEFANKLISIEPISAISIIFAIAFMYFCRYSMKILKESFDMSVKEIKNSYSEASKILKEIIDTNQKNKE